MDFLSNQDLLAGPRGRELCFELAKLAAPVRPGETYGSGVLPPPGMSREGEQLLRILAGIPERPVFTASELHRSLAGVVRRATYWQPPDEAAQLLAEPEPCGALLPVAAAVVRSPAAAWWFEPAAPVTHYVQWVQTSTVPGTTPPALDGSGQALARWRAGVVSQEANTPFPEGWTGRWWSSPSLSRLVSTTPAVPGQGPAGLELVEDPLDWTYARSYPLRAAPDARMFEIRGPGDWQELAVRYPLDVTRSRGSSWNTAVPQARCWVMPDWSAVAEDYDGVHLTVAGYLSTAGVPVAAGAVPDAGTGEAALAMLAGWAPWETWWLNDVLEPAGEPTGWQAAGEAGGRRGAQSADHPVDQPGDQPMRRPVDQPNDQPVDRTTGHPPGKPGGQSTHPLERRPARRPGEAGNREGGWGWQVQAPAPGAGPT